MEYNVTELRENLALAGAQLEVFRARFEDDGDDKQANVFYSILRTVAEVDEFLNELEDCDDDDFDD